MYRIAQNIWLDRMRARKVRGVSVGLETAEEISGSDGRNVVESRQDLAAVGAAMAELPEDLRALVALVCIDGLSYKEAVEISAAPIGMVMSRLPARVGKLHARLHGPPPATARGASKLGSCNDQAWR